MAEARPAGKRRRAEAAGARGWADLAAGRLAAAAFARALAIRPDYAKVR